MSVKEKKSVNMGKVCQDRNDVDSTDIHSHPDAEDTV